MIEKKVCAELILSDGSKFKGFAFGHIKETCGNVIFSTRVTGYQELLTDPSLTGQILTLTYPLIGNVGINLEDMESDSVKVKGIVIRELCDYPSNWRCEIGLSDFLKQHKIMGIEGIDTRALTRVLRDKGSMPGIITTRAAEMSPGQLSEKFQSLHNLHAVREVSTKEKYEINSEGASIHIAVLDLGLKRSLLKQLTAQDVSVTVFPYDTDSQELLSCDALFISNGPDGTEDIPKVVDMVSKLLGKINIFGVDLGCLVIGQALGCDVSRLKFGHHGNNYPVSNVATGEIYITEQNHNYVISSVSDNCTVTFVNINDNSIAGIANERLGAYGVSFIPQSSNSVHNVDNSIVKFIRSLKK